MHVQQKGKLPLPKTYDFSRKTKNITRPKILWKVIKFCGKSYCLWNLKGGETLTRNLFFFFWINFWVFQNRVFPFLRKSLMNTANLHCIKSVI